MRSELVSGCVVCGWGLDIRLSVRTGDSSINLWFVVVSCDMKKKGTVEEFRAREVEKSPR